MVRLYKPLQSATKISSHLFSHSLESPRDFELLYSGTHPPQTPLFLLVFHYCRLEHDPIQGAQKSRSDNEFYSFRHHGMNGVEWALKLVELDVFYLRISWEFTDPRKLW